VARSEESITVLLATDSFLIGAGLVELLAKYSEVKVVGWARDQEELLRLMAELVPEALIITIRTPMISTMGTISTARRLRQEYPELSIVIISDQANGFAIELLRGGASRIAFLLDDKLPSMDTVLDALRTLRLGHSVLDPSIVDALVGGSGGSHTDRFTMREVDVLEQMAHGLSNRAVAAELHLSMKSVEKHITVIFRKLGLSDQTLVDRRVVAALTYLRSQVNPFADLPGQDLDVHLVVPWAVDDILVYGRNNRSEAL
jgi:DNA-binding NarL/FixJ family response regulator